MALDVNTVVGHVQNFVHGSACTLVLPGSLLLVSAAMLTYRHVTEDRFDLPLNGFLANIMLQMLPLIALKIKIWSCNDRVSLVPLVLVKTILMHVILGIMRVLSQVIAGVHLGRMQLAFDVVLLVAAVTILRYVFEFPLSPMRILEQRDVRNLVGLAVSAAFLSEAFFVYVQPMWLSEATRLYTSEGLRASKVFFAASNYVDIVAFMPVVWRLYQADNELEDCAVGTVVSVEARRQVQLFFLFVGTFYLWDDVIDPIMNLLDEPVAMMAHAAHFMLLVDFAGFFIFQVGNPTTGGTKERGEQLQGLLAEGGLEED
mmetsp:Transcript_615/g.1929  ORF Transcript_615/g.1929 Transcript_615/m.1929 type:complete len:315 (-) Transcript_615:92-1036(-)